VSLHLLAFSDVQKSYRAHGNFREKPQSFFKKGRQALSFITSRKAPPLLTGPTVVASPSLRALRTRTRRAKSDAPLHQIGSRATVMYKSPLCTGQVLVVLLYPTKMAPS
jgi:hypothetical protein